MFGQAVFWGLSLRPGTDGRSRLLHFYFARARAYYAREKGRYSRYFCIQLSGMQGITCSYSSLFGATAVATAPNGVRIFSNGGSIFPNGGSIFQNGISIFPSSLLSACSYQSSSIKSGIATNNHLLISPFSAKVAPVAPFSRAHYTRAHARGGGIHG